jgi:polysaccharide export outer membrane protein
MSIATVLLIFVTSAGLVVGQTPVPPQVADVLDNGSPTRPSLQRSEYHVGQDDLLEIVVFEIPELGITTRVAASGHVSLPLIGPVQVSGMTTQELATEVEESLRANYIRDPHVTVLIREYASQPVPILGAVNAPGIYQMKGQKRLLEMLSMAQGLNEEPGSTIQVIRAPSGSPSEDGTVPPSESISISIEELLEQGKTELNIPIYAGDVINVLQAGSVFVVGEALAPGQKVLRNGRNVTVTQAVALAGGFTLDARRDESLIIRVHLDGSREEIPVGDANKILRGEVPDVVMLPNDILWVPPNKAKPILRRVLDTTIGVVTGLLVLRGGN